MNRLSKFQLIGPIAIFLTVLVAEGAAYALPLAPRSEWLWYANIKLFTIFQRAHYVLSDFTSVPGAQLFLIALPILAMAVLGLMYKQKLALALASNLSFVYATFLVVSWNVLEQYSLQASLSLVVIPSGPGLYTMLILLGTSLISFAISHILYFAAIRSKA
jgi:hypothetical protein